MPAPRKFKAVMKELETPKSEAEPQATLLTNGGMTQAGLQTTVLDLPPQTKKSNKDYLKDRWSNLSARMMDWLLQGNRLEQMMGETKLSQLGIMAGIATDKVLLLEGQPTTIIGQAEHKKIDELLPALIQEIQRRGGKTELTERKAVLTIEPTNDPNT